MKGALRRKSTRLVRKAGWGAERQSSATWKRKTNMLSICCLLLLFSQLLGCVQLFCNPMDCSTTRLLCPWNFLGKNTYHPLLQDLHNPGIEPTSPTLGRFFTTEPQGRNSHISKHPQLSEHSFQPWSKTGLCRAKITVLCMCVFFYRRSLFTLFSNLAGDQKLPGVDLKRTPPSHCSSTPDVLISPFYSPLHKGSDFYLLCSLRNGTQSSYIQ